MVSITQNDMLVMFIHEWTNDCYGSGGTIAPSRPPSLSVRLHVILDHQIIESIFNNRTAIVSYVDPSKMDATSFSVVSAFGTKDATGVSVHLETWSLGGVME